MKVVRACIITLLFSLVGALHAQASKIKDADPMIVGGAMVYRVPDEMAEPPGGVNALRMFICRNIRYPQSAMVSGISGKVYLSMIITSKGRVANISVLREVPGCRECSEEAIRVLRMCPNWTPAKKDGRPVNMAYHLPVSFSIVDASGSSVTDRNEVASQKSKEAQDLLLEGRTFEKHGSYALALQKYKEALDLDPASAEALFNVARMTIADGNVSLARQLFLELEHDADFGYDAQAHLSCCTQEGAQKFIERCNGKVSEEYFDYALMAIDDSRFGAAISNLDSCLKYKRNNPDAWYNKAAMHHKVGQKAEACEAWKQLLAISPKDSETKGLIEQNCN